MSAPTLSASDGAEPPPSADVQTPQHVWAARLHDLDSAPLFAVDMNGNVTMWSFLISQLSGVSKDEALGHCFVDRFISQECTSAANAVIEAARVATQTTRWVFPILTQDDILVDAPARATTHVGKDGAATSAAFSVDTSVYEADSTKLQQTHPEAQDFSRRIELASASSFEVDTLGSVTLWNPEMTRISGFTKDEAMGRSLVKQFITHRSRRSVNTVLEEALAGIQTPNCDFSIRTLDGTLTVNATATAQGLHLGAVFVLSTEGYGSQVQRAPVSSTVASALPADTTVAP